MKKPNFPKALFVSRNGYCDEDGFDTFLRKQDHAELNETVEVAEYKLVRVTKLRGEIREFK